MTRIKTKSRKMRTLFILCLLVSSKMWGEGKGRFEVLKVGVILPLTKSMATYGEEMKVALEIARRDLEPSLVATSQVIQIDFLDHESGVNLIRPLVHQLKNQHIHILMGGISEPVANALIEESNRNQIPLFLPKLSPHGRSYQSNLVITSDHTKRLELQSLLNYAVDLYPRKTFQLITNLGDPYSVEMADLFKKFMARLNKSYDTLDIQPGVENEEFHHFEEENLEGRVLYYPSSRPRELSSFLDKQNLSPSDKIIALSELDSLIFRGVRVRHERQLVYINNYKGPFANGLESLQTFEVEFGIRTKRYPSLLALLAYDSYVIMAKAFQAAKTSRKPEFMRMLYATKNVPGLLGPTGLLDDGTAIRPMILTHFQDGMKSILVP